MIEKIYVCGGSDGRILKELECLDLETNQWKALESMKSRREEHGLTTGFDKKIYAIGGFNGKSCLRTVERYDPSKNQWEEVAPMNTSRRSLSAITLPNGIYVLGGYDGEFYLNTVERYDITTNQWFPIKSFKQARCTMACVGDSRFIYILGGYDDKPLNSVERYDVVKDEWMCMRDMKNKRFMHAACMM